MAYQINLKTFTDNRGNLTVIERVIPFAIKRVFYIYGVDSSERGGHRHRKTVQAAICVQGGCTIINNNGREKQNFELNTPDKCLILNPEDWHVMCDFTPNAILMVFASEHFDPADYIHDPYPSLVERSKMEIMKPEPFTSHEYEINRYYDQPKQQGRIRKNDKICA